MTESNGTSLVRLTTDSNEQTRIMDEYMLDYIDVIECWHPRNGVGTADHYTAFARKHGLLMTSGSNCH